MGIRRRNRRIGAALAGVVLAACAEPPRAIALRWKTSVGETLLYEIRLEDERSVEPPSASASPDVPEPRKITLQGVLAAVVLATPAPGVLDFSLSYRDLVVEGEGKAHFQLVYRNGRIEREEGSPSAKAELDRFRSQAQKVATVRIEPLGPRTSALPHSFSWPALPSHPVRPGERWEERLGLTGPAGYTLSSTSDPDIFALTARSQHIQSDGEQTTHLSRVREASFSLSRGKFLSLEDDLRTEVRTGGGVRILSRTTLRLRMVPGPLAPTSAPK